jgi:ubiquinone/menaquinone biosynthesis C-methylase UbiE
MKGPRVGRRFPDERSHRPWRGTQDTAVTARSDHWRTLGPSRRPARGARVGWERAAASWDQFVETKSDYHRWKLHGPALLRAVGDVEGSRVLDLGCGQGWFSRQLARRGARVTGLDWSPSMIAIARERERRHPLGVGYVCADATSIGKRWPARSFDLVAACMSLQDMPRPDRALRGAARVLKPRGRVVVSVLHPVNTAPEAHWTTREPGRHGPWILDGYFDEGPKDVRWRLRPTERVIRIPQWHRTFENWFRLFVAGGLVVTHVWEPRPTALQAKGRTGFEGPRRVPFFLVLEARHSPFE